MSGISTSLFMSLAAQRSFLRNSNDVNMSLVRLATAQRINRAADSPAGLISSENLRATLAQLQAQATATERVDQVASTADSALGQISDMLGDASALVTASAGDGVSAEERQANQLELDSILSTVNRIASSTSFNGDPLLDGTATLSVPGASVALQAVNSSSLGDVQGDGQSTSLADLGTGRALNLVNGDLEGAQAAVDAAISQVSTLRGRIGAFQKDTLGTRLDSLNVAIMNTAAAESAIRDTDYAAETGELNRSQLMALASLRVLSMVNDQQRSVLSLLA